MDKKKTVALILAQLKPHAEEGVGVGFEEPGHEAEESEESHDEQLHAIAEELVSAVRSGDAKSVAEALRGAFACLEKQPHVEGRHLKGSSEEDENEEYGEDDASEYGYGGRAMYAKGGSVPTKARDMLASMQKNSYAAGGGVVGDVLRKQAKTGKVGGKLARAILAGVK